MLTDKTFKRPCGDCNGCLMARYSRIVGGAMAQAETSGCVLSITLTYADIMDAAGSMVAPDGAVNLDYSHIVNLMARLRKKYKCTKIVAGEYGGLQGRGHWHLLAFFDHDERNKNAWFQDFVYGSGTHTPEMQESWRANAPPLVLDQLPKKEFQRVLDDPSVLWASTMGRKYAGTYAQNWSMWPHGKVEVKLCKAGALVPIDEVNRAVRYTCKYLSKDIWRDSSKFKYTNFSDLPEHVRQGTNYDPGVDVESGSRRKWRRGNSYRKELAETLLRKYASDDDVPVEERLKIGRYNYRTKGGLGALFFRALGVRCATQLHTTNEERAVKRRYDVGPNFMRKQRSAVLRAIEEFRLPESVQKRFSFQMSDTNFLQFGEGFKAQFERQFGESTLGPEFVFDDLQTKAKQASDVASGPFGYHIWAKASPAERAGLEKIWGAMPNEALRGLVPSRLIALLEETSSLSGWPEKRRDRLRLADEGKVLHTFEIGIWAKLLFTSRGLLIYERARDNGSPWWRRRLDTFEDFDNAMGQTLLPPDALIMRREKEGNGDQRKLSTLGKRAVLAKVRAALLVREKL